MPLRFKKGGEQTECLRLARSIARSLYAIIIHHLNMKVSVPDICKDVAQNVALFYKVNVSPDHILAMGFEKFGTKATTGSQASTQHGC